MISKRSIADCKGSLRVFRALFGSDPVGGTAAVGPPAADSVTLELASDETSALSVALTTCVAGLPAASQAVGRLTSIHAILDARLHDEMVSSP